MDQDRYLELVLKQLQSRLERVRLRLRVKRNCATHLVVSPVLLQKGGK